MASVCVVIPPPTRSLGAPPLPITAETVESWVREQGFHHVYDDDPSEQGSVKGFALFDNHSHRTLHVYIALESHKAHDITECFIITVDGHELCRSYKKALEYLKRHIF